jgi:hypothetical protein
LRRVTFSTSHTPDKCHMPPVPRATGLTLHPSITGDGPFGGAQNGKRFAAESQRFGTGREKTFLPGLAVALIRMAKVPGADGAQESCTLQRVIGELATTSVSICRAEGRGRILEPVYDLESRYGEEAGKAIIWRSSVQ